MHSYSPQKEGNLHITLPILLFIISMICVICTIVGNVIPDYIMQLAAIASAALAIQIITRYSLTRFIYEITEDKTYLKITKVTGKKSTLAGDIELRDIVAVTKKEKDLSLKEKYKKSFKNHNFCNNLFPQSSYYLILDVAGDDIAVLIECEQAFIDLINKYKNTSKGENQ